MPRKQHTYHFIYKTTNLLNNKFYIGMHSTSNLQDGYIGSGKYLWNSIKKYGLENFKFEILEWFQNRDLLKEREIKLIDDTTLKDPLCMNIRLGGGGIRYGTKLSEETRKKMSKPRTEEHRRNMSQPRTEEHKLHISESCKGKKKPPRTQSHASKLAAANTGKKQSEETKLKRALSLLEYNKNKSAEQILKKSESLKRNWILRKQRIK